MANICTNRLTVSGPVESMNKFYFMKKSYFSDVLSPVHITEKVFSPVVNIFNLKEHEGVSSENINNKSKKDTSYREDEISECDIYREDESITSYKVEFDSKWSPPIDFIRLLSSIHPELEFSINSCEMGNEFANSNYFKSVGTINEICKEKDLSSIYDISEDELALLAKNDGYQINTEEDLDEYRWSSMSDRIHQTLDCKVVEHELVKVDAPIERDIVDFVLYGNGKGLAEKIKKENIDWTKECYFLYGKNPLFVSILDEQTSTKGQESVIKSLVNSIGSEALSKLRDQDGNNILHYIIGSLSFKNPDLAYDMIEFIGNDDKIMNELMLSSNGSGVLPGMYDSTFITDVNDYGTSFDGDIFLKMCDLIEKTNFKIEEKIIPFLTMTTSLIELNKMQVTVSDIAKSFINLTKTNDMTDNAFVMLLEFTESISNSLHKYNDKYEKNKKLLIDVFVEISKHENPLTIESKSVLSKLSNRSSGVKTLAILSIEKNIEDDYFIINTMKKLLESGMRIDFNKDVISKEQQMDKNADFCFKDVFNDHVYSSCEKIYNYLLLKSEKDIDYKSDNIRIQNQPRI